ncbi:quinoprotein relay system zinc metallohydrolase 2 [Paracoccus tegillarcae]|uniref:MBL fold metallo-hydrolase n=1 Tax=Paracoccus tegillarcae TaxID=1529068 RepID=A0A2K9EIT3_9RHOB|nr:quinoprotein relay system zinc metallohydrolase 2 [Paracoccus tegillarcae]AUH33277.1 MBL fold metallo-hydrolase [Paracoccus tegillarcae]
MFHLILTACIAVDSGDCRPILLPQGDGLTPQACLSQAERISRDWLADHPDLTGSGTECIENTDVGGLELHSIAPGVWLRQGQTAQIASDNRGRIANLSVIIGTDSVAIIDAGASRAEGQDLYAAIRHLTPKPVSHVILTHMHPDHVLGASVFAEAGASIVANEKLVQSLDMRGQGYLENMSRIVGAPEMIGTEITLPDMTIAQSDRISLGGRTLELAAVPTAHTDNDLIVRDDATNTLFTGDLVFRDLTPVVDGSLNGWLHWLEAPPAEVGLIVPGHGPVAQNWQEAVAKQSNLLLQLRDSVRHAIASGQSMSEAVPTIVSELQNVAEGWTDFDDTIARDATAAFKELEWE